MHLISPPPPKKKKFALALFSISLGTAVIPRRNEKQVMQNYGWKIRCIMGEMQVANVFHMLKIPQLHFHHHA